MKRLPVQLTTTMSEFAKMHDCLYFDGVLCDSVHDCLIVPNSAFYQKKARTLQGVPPKVFGQKFFDYRDALSLQPDASLDLDHFFTEANCEWQDVFPCFNIMMNKDGKSIELLSTYLGFFEKVLKIYSKQFNVDKNVQFDVFFEERHIEPVVGPVIFVDDTIENLQKTHYPNQNLFHATLGSFDKQEVNPFAKITIDIVFHY